MNRPSDYTDTMTAAGAVVHIAQDFGDYQGTTWARVTYGGREGWVSYSYGSCSGCDSFQSEFGWNFGQTDDYEDRPLTENEEARVLAFGRDLLDPILTQAEAEAKAAKHSEWDSEADRVLAFLRANAVEDE